MKSLSHFRLLAIPWPAAYQAPPSMGFSRQDILPTIYQLVKYNISGTSRVSLVAQMVKNPPLMWEAWVQSLGWENLLEEGTATHSNILAWRMDREAWQATVHGVAKRQTRLSDEAHSTGSREISNTIRQGTWKQSLVSVH